MNTLTNKVIIAAILTAIAAILTSSLTTQVFAASTTDNEAQASDNDNDSNNSTSSITPTDVEQQPQQDEQNKSDSNNQKIVLTAIPEKNPLTRGTTQSVAIKATTDNGTAIPDVSVQSIISDFATGKLRVLLGGQTDDKGE